MVKPPLHLSPFRPERRSGASRKGVEVFSFHLLRASLSLSLFTLAALLFHLLLPGS